MGSTMLMTLSDVGPFARCLEAGCVHVQKDTLAGETNEEKPTEVSTMRLSYGLALVKVNCMLIARYRTVWEGTMAMRTPNDRGGGRLRALEVVSLSCSCVLLPCRSIYRRQHWTVCRTGSLFV